MGPNIKVSGLKNSEDPAKGPSKLARSKITVFRNLDYFILWTKNFGHDIRVGSG